MATETIGKTSEITVFLKEGSTLMFYDCDMLKGFGVNNDFGDVCDIVFSYISKNTGKVKQALFCTSEIAGYSFARD